LLLVIPVLILLLDIFENLPIFRKVVGSLAMELPTLEKLIELRVEASSLGDRIT
jgi:hypothetical protein